MSTHSVEYWAERSVLCWLATSDGNGLPNVSPKEMFMAVDDSHLLIADIASPRSVANIRVNPQVCVALLDIFVQRGCKLRGTASIIEQGQPEFLAQAAPLLAMGQGQFPIRRLISIAVEGVSDIVAPSYRLIAGTTEASQREAAFKRYGVKPLEASQG